MKKVVKKSTNNGLKIFTVIITFFNSNFFRNKSF